MSGSRGEGTEGNGLTDGAPDRPTPPPARGPTRPQRMDRMKRAPTTAACFRTVLISLVLGFPVLAGTATAQQPKGAATPAVTVVKVEQRDVAPSTSFTGRIEAIDKVDLRARVEGFLEQQLFTEDQDVKAGDLLFVIEKAPYQAEIENVEAAIARAQATLDRAELERRPQGHRGQGPAGRRLAPRRARSPELRRRAVQRRHGHGPGPRDAAQPEGLPGG
jgi:multidrug efflux pump subunit AcrA (membrane-fusion protein)